MRALVVFESMYGNTEKVARAIADGLSARLNVEIVEVGGAPSRIADDIDLLVVGGPTHARGMSDPRTRGSARGKTERDVVSSGIGIREWLDRLTDEPTGTAAAAFDTHIKGPHLVWGGAARTIDEHLRRLGCRVVATPEGFHVDGPLGPVVDVVVEGEIERARRWGEELGARMGAGSTAQTAQPV
jgi:hypothetical protein